MINGTLRVADGFCIFGGEAQFDFSHVEIIGGELQAPDGEMLVYGGVFKDGKGQPVITAMNWEVEDGRIKSVSQGQTFHLHEDAAKNEPKLNGWGAGSQLKKILSSMGISARPSCNCMRTAAEMDENGIQWCKDHTDKIANVMKREAAARGWPLANTPMAKAGAVRIVKLAIKRAEVEERKRGVDA